jgi:LacI family transcriptional regulator
MATMQDVARLANVSQATVSRVINGSAVVSDETKSIVMKCIRELKYEPNLSAKALVENRSLIIALVIPDLMNYFFMDIIYQVEKIISTNGYSLMLFNSDGSKERERSIAKTLRSRLVDGVLASFVSGDSQLKKELIADSFPVVAITQDHEEFHSVSVSHESGGALAAQLFLENGYSKFYYIGTLDDPKYRGFKAHLLQNGISESAVSMFDIGRFWFHTGDKAYQLLREGYRSGEFDARQRIGFFCINDIIALGAMQALLDIGVAPGEKGGVIGFDDTHICQNLRPRLTSIAQPKEEMVNIAVGLLLEELEANAEGGTKKEREHIFLKPRLAKRESA